MAEANPLALSNDASPRSGKNTSPLPDVLARLRADIMPYAESNRDAVLSFRREMYGHESIYSDPEYLRSLYHRDSARAQPLGRLWVLHGPAGIDAQQGALPVALKAGSETYSAAWVVEVMVRPARRNQGVAKLFDEVAARECGLLAALEVSDAGRRLFNRIGWTDLGIVPLFVRPLRLRRVAAARSRRPGIALLCACADPVIRSFDSITARLFTLAGYSLERVVRFDERIDRLWERASPAYPIVGRRDSGFLNSKFVRYRPERYALFHVLRRGAVVGYVVIRIDSWRGIPSGFIADFFCQPAHTTALLALALHHFRSVGAAMAYCLNANPAGSLPFRLLGFLKRASGWPLMVRASEWPASTVALARQQSSWFITSADGAVDRPRPEVVAS